MNSKPGISLTIALVFLTFLPGCFGSSDAPPPAPAANANVTLTAALVTANQVARFRTTGASTLRQTGSSQRDSSLSNQDLVGIAIDGTAWRVFNVSVPVYRVETTTGSVIVSGDFVSTNTVDSAGNPFACTLLAISKTASGKSTDLTCLSKNQVGDYSPSLSANNAHYSHYGFATRGNKVYFTDFAAGALYSWADGDASPALLFQQTPGFPETGLDDIFVDKTSSNLCVLMAALSSYPGALYCGTDAGLTAMLTGSSGNDVLAETTTLGKWVVSTYAVSMTSNTATKVDLTNLIAGPQSRNFAGSNGALAEGTSFVNTTAGGVVGLGYAWSLINMDSSGNTALLDDYYNVNNLYWQTLVGLGNYAWTYASTTSTGVTSGVLLRRIDVTSSGLENTTSTNINILAPDSALDTTNCFDYLASGFTNTSSVTCHQDTTTLGMASISSLFTTADGRIQITGKDGSGNALTAFISASGAITAGSSTTTAVDQIQGI